MIGQDRSNEIHGFTTYILREVYGKFLYRFTLYAIYFLDNYLRLSYL